MVRLFVALAVEVTDTCAPVLSIRIVDSDQPASSLG